MKISELIKQVRKAKKVLFYVDGHGGMYVIAVKSDYLFSLVNIQKAYGPDHDIEVTTSLSQPGLWLYVNA